MTIQTSKFYSLFAKLIVSVLIGQLIKNIHAIQGGNDVDAETFAARFPWVVGLRFGRGTQNTCTGVLISSTLVLTAKHCTTSYYLLTHVVLDTPKNLPFEGTFRQIAAFHDAPTSDYMLVEMEEPVQTTPLKLRRVSHEDFIKDDRRSKPRFELIALGFGVTSGNSWHSTTQLQQVAMRLRCSQFRSPKLKLNQEGCLLAKTKSTEASMCHGDSGGPLIAFDKSKPTHEQEPILVGIYSAVFSDPMEEKWTMDRESVPMRCQRHVSYRTFEAVYEDVNNILERMSANAWNTYRKDCIYQFLFNKLVVSNTEKYDEAIENCTKMFVKSIEAGASYTASLFMGGDTQVKFMTDEPDLMQQDHTQPK